MAGDDKLTESVRIRLTPTEKRELEQRAAAEERSESAIGRRGIRHELDRLRKRPSGRS